MWPRVSEIRRKPAAAPPRPARHPPLTPHTGKYTYYPMTPQPQPPTNPEHLQTLDTLIALGTTLAQHIVAEATTTPQTPEHTQANALAFDRVTRAVRRTILLAQKISQTPTKPNARTAARKRILREVEDCIQSEATGPEAEALTAELHERLDAPDLEDDLESRPIQDIIQDIQADLGIAIDLPGHHSWKRRTPRDIEALRARAARPPRAEAPRAEAPRPGTPPASAHPGHAAAPPAAHPRL